MKSKTIYIITLNGYFNFGNRLQNYALTRYLSLLNYNVYTYWEKNIIDKIKISIKLLSPIKEHKRFKKIFLYSKKYIKESSKINKANFVVIGSDQVWNPIDAKNNSVLLGATVETVKISYAASFGVKEIPYELVNYYKENLSKIDYLSLREENGKQIIEKLLGKVDSQVLIDPTMLIDCKEWEKICIQPKNIKKIKCDRYILVYFLGKLSNSRKKEIERVAYENKCKIINILDQKSPFYVSGPSEFLWLEKNAYLICTDSFHSSVFALLFNRPFVIFNREEEGMENMGSRIETLLNKFKIENRRYNGLNITKENIEHNYTEAYKILEEERKKSDAFLRKALDFKE